MTTSYLKALAASAAMLMISGIANMASAGTPLPFQPFAGGSFGVLEEAVGLDVELTIQNPAGSGLSVFGLMVGLPQQDLTADTANIGWSSDDFNDSVEMASFVTPLEAGLGFEPGALDTLFAGFFDPEDGPDTVLAFFTLGEIFFPVEAGFQLAEFFGLFAEPETDFFLFAFDDQFNTVIVSGQTTIIDGAAAVPEPGTLALFGIGVIGIGLAVRRRRRT